MSVSEVSWPDGSPSDGLLFELSDGDLAVRVTPLGASLAGVTVPAARGPVETVLRFPNASGYRDNPSNFGSIVGRYANRIGGGRFELGGQTFELEVNNGPNCLHSGSANFAKRLWKAEPIGDSTTPAIRFSLESPDGDGGFPGRLTAAVTYRLSGDTLSIVYEAESDADTVVSLTNHAYWNLAGHESGDARSQHVQINADRLLAVDENTLPTGEFVDVGETPFDFRERTPVDARWKAVKSLGLAGYDHCYALTSPTLESVAAELFSPVSDILMTVRTTLPGCQLYTAAHLDGSPSNAGYGPYSGVCLECQQFPDSPNHLQFPSTVLKPGQPLCHETTHTFAAS